MLGPNRRGEIPTPLPRGELRLNERAEVVSMSVLAVQDARRIEDDRGFSSRKSRATHRLENRADVAPENSIVSCFQRDDGKLGGEKQVSHPVGLRRCGPTEGECSDHCCVHRTTHGVRSS
jgi:hypothetical protein